MKTARIPGPRRVALLLALGLACSGEHLGPGEPHPTARKVAVPDEAPQILFGDLHTHTHFSLDAWAVNLPILGGEGAHPPADACDFARFCSNLDFWSINDHAEGLTPRHWAETREAVRACNAVTDPAAPDLVTFLGWEWSQVGITPEEHFGHKNVVLRDTADSETPARPIAAPRDDFRESHVPAVAGWLLPLVDFGHRQHYFDWIHRNEEVAETSICPAGVDSRELPVDCLEVARDPGELFEKLDQSGFASLVIPHGTSWGLMTPPRTELASQLSKAMHDPDRQALFEIYSGHGSAELHRSYRAEGLGPDGGAACDEPAGGYTPCCWRAGEIIRERCDDPAAPLCQERVRRARADFLRAGVGGYRTIPGATAEDWLDCGQCPDCELGAFDHRPGGSAQAALAATAHDGSDARFRFGFVGSSDTHRARPGNGYKEIARSRMTDAMGKLGGLLGNRAEPEPESRRIELADLPIQQRRYIERQGSFYTTGGLVAAVARGRTREAIWEALSSRRVYGTSGPRILLEFEAATPDGTFAMGSEAPSRGTPHFRVRATGARKQLPGCPDKVTQALGPERLETLCAGHCHHPGDERWRMEAIEVVRIRPQLAPTEPLDELIEDPWRRLACPPGAEACEVEFEDPGFQGEGREVVYYVRALQEPTPAIGADPLRCERDAEGRCLSVRLCEPDEECLAPVRERAWSSPIFLRPVTAEPGA